MVQNLKKVVSGASMYLATPTILRQADGRGNPCL